MRASGMLISTNVLPMPVRPVFCRQGETAVRRHGHLVRNDRADRQPSHLDLARKIDERDAAAATVGDEQRAFLARTCPWPARPSTGTEKQRSQWTVHQAPASKRDPTLTSTVACPSHASVVTESDHEAGVGVREAAHHVRARRTLTGRTPRLIEGYRQLGVTKISRRTPSRHTTARTRRPGGGVRPTTSPNCPTPCDLYSPSNPVMISPRLNPAVSAGPSRTTCSTRTPLSPSGR